MGSLSLDILIVLLMIIANGVFAMSEIAIISARKARLQQRAEEGDPRAQVALELANDPTRFLSTIQVGITLVGILAGAFGGATIAGKLAVYFTPIPLLAPYREIISLAIVVLATTYLTLVIGELAPKQLALANTEGIASAVAGPMRTLSRLAGPVVDLLSLSAESVVRLLGVDPGDEQPVTEEELRILLEQGTRAGVFERAEQQIVEGAFLLDDRRVSLMMTLRTEIVWLDLEDPGEENWQKMVASGRSHFPVCKGHLDNVMGFVSVKRIWARMMAGQPIDLGTLLTKPLFVPETMSALRLLESFRRSRAHMALVIDEYSSIQGLVTLFDVLEAIVGDIPSTGEPTRDEAVQREDGSWLLDGLLPLDEFKKIFSIGDLPGEEDYQTVGGFAMTRLGHIPAVGERFRWSGLRFEIVEMDGLRIAKLVVSPAKTSRRASKEPGQMADD